MPCTAKAKNFSSSSSSDKSSANLGFDAKLWLRANKLQNNMDAEERKHEALGQIFLN